MKMHNFYVVIAVLVCMWLLPRSNIVRYEFTCQQCIIVIPVFENINMFTKPANATTVPTYVHADTAHIVRLP